MNSLPIPLRQLALQARENRLELEPRLLSMTIVHHGGVLRTDGEQPCLVGEMRWLSATWIGWFPAFGDRADDARTFRFDGVRLDGDALVFVCGASAIATLCPIECAVVEDPDDYRIGWQLWLELVPLRRAFIDASFEKLIGRLETEASG